MLMQTDAILEVEGVSKIYSRVHSSTRQRLAGVFGRTLVGRSVSAPHNLKNGEFWSLKDISFSLKRGEALGIIGLNGAGKTTLLRILSGQILPDDGEIRMLGKTAAMIDLTAGFQMTASGKRNIQLRGAMLGRSRQNIEASFDAIIAFADLGVAIDAPVNTYSSGMLMRLAFAIMIEMEPDILFIDEVLAVGDFLFQQKCLARIRELRERSAFVLVSHSMSSIKLFCGRVLVLNMGKLVYDGSPEEAVELYQELQFPQTNPEARQKRILKPQFHNHDAIRDVEHYWSDERGNRIDKISTGETLYFHISYSLNIDTRNPVMGVPVWTQAGEYVTGFSTELGTKNFDTLSARHHEFILEIPGLAFNPGEYISNFAITDGPEFLYREENPVLTVTPMKKRHFGMVSLPHKWRESRATTSDVL